MLWLITIISLFSFVSFIYCQHITVNYIHTYFVIIVSQILLGKFLHKVRLLPFLDKLCSLASRSRPQTPHVSRLQVVRNQQVLKLVTTSIPLLHSLWCPWESDGKWKDFRRQSYRRGWYILISVEVWGWSQTVFYASKLQSFHSLLINNKSLFVRFR